MSHFAVEIGGAVNPPDWTTFAEGYFRRVDGRAGRGYAFNVTLPLSLSDVSPRSHQVRGKPFALVIWQRGIGATPEPAAHYEIATIRGHGILPADRLGGLRHHSAARPLGTTRSPGADDAAGGTSGGVGFTRSGKIAPHRSCTLWCRAVSACGHPAASFDKTSVNRASAPYRSDRRASRYSPLRGHRLQAIRTMT